MKNNLLLTLALIILIFTMFILNIVKINEQKNINICDETWFKKRFSTSLPNENIVFRDKMNEIYDKECLNNNG